jgi:hypothetical protein
MFLQHHAARGSTLGAEHLQRDLRRQTFLRGVNDSPIHPWNRSRFLPRGSAD